MSEIVVPNKTIYWSNLECFEKCPLKFLWKHGFPGLDLGAGPGNPKPVDIKRSEHHSIMGSAIQAAIESWYNTGEWKKILDCNNKNNKIKEVADFLSDLSRKELKDRMYAENAYVDWREAPPYSEMEKTCVDGVVGYIKTIIANRLVGSVNVAEKRVVVDNPGLGIKIGAKMDVYIEKERDSKYNPGITILDGKNSKKRGKYTDPNQLVFYATCIFLESGIIPDRLGFAYYRYPFGAAINSKEISKGVDWISFNEGDIEMIISRVKDMRSKMEEFGSDYPANPSPNNCMWCEWECDARRIQKDINRGSRKKFVIDVKECGEDGFSEISFNENRMISDREVETKFLVFVPEPGPDGFSEISLGSTLVGDKNDSTKYDQKKSG